ncbi:hypothetical protein ABFO97_11950 [Acinetobacter baumannii]|uniref:hypothetical protein n=1 Tax=Acinetobacter baumannii TaxID=470 RepID=UPI0008198CD9|nr:hypothetical protein [Acinetobacter baumannii]EIB7123255.1 hypothetical protein [Acinetobacter baumannii]MCT9283108.1 hypothetical protein [Acinetobacter baumannii]MDA5694345.1 hypothetical protein [Acinetobacter baumannii]MDC4379147.1 hypothetical protein [Acinetobacter baumannii]OTK92471.1 hypothetical protein B9X85_11040 [Acinetobacter baumannii]
MLTFKENFLKLKSELKADQCFNLVVIIIIGCIFMLSYLALLRPVNSEQYQRIVQLSRQATYPRTQDMAELIMAQSEIHRAEYLKLMHTYQFEHDHIKQYPALAQEDTQ